jgi:hypothetical protein
MPLRTFALLLNPGAWSLAPQLPGLLAAAGRALALALHSAGRRAPLNSAFARPARRGPDRFRRAPGPALQRSPGGAPLSTGLFQTSGDPGPVPGAAPGRRRLYGYREPKVAVKGAAEIKQK